MPGFQHSGCLFQSSTAELVVARRHPSECCHQARFDFTCVATLSGLNKALLDSRGAQKHRVASRRVASRIFVPRATSMSHLSRCSHLPFMSRDSEHGGFPNPASIFSRNEGEKVKGHSWATIIHTKIEWKIELPHFFINYGKISIFSRLRIYQNIIFLFVCKKNFFFYKYKYKYIYVFGTKILFLQRIIYR